MENVNGNERRIPVDVVAHNLTTNDEPRGLASVLARLTRLSVDPMDGPSRAAPPTEPTLDQAASTLRREIEATERKLEFCRRRNEPADVVARGEVILANLNSTTPEQLLAMQMETYRRLVSEWAEKLKAERWEKFIAIRGKRYKSCTLENYKIEHPGQAEAVEAIRRYGSDIEANISAGVGVLLFGPCGTGKDHLLTSLSRTAIERGFTIEWKTGTIIYSEADNALKSHWLTGQFSDVLVISDPSPPGGLDNAGGFSTRTTANWLHMMIDRAYSDQRPIWCSLNAANKEQAVGQLGAQIIDRLTHDAIVLSCEWPTYREPRESA